MTNNRKTDFWEKQFRSLENEYNNLYRCFESSYNRNKDANVRIGELLKGIDKAIYNLANEDVTDTYVVDQIRMELVELLKVK